MSPTGDFRVWNANTGVHLSEYAANPCPHPTRMSSIHFTANNQAVLGLERQPLNSIAWRPATGEKLSVLGSSGGSSSPEYTGPAGGLYEKNEYDLTIHDDRKKKGQIATVKGEHWVHWYRHGSPGPNQFSQAPLQQLAHPTVALQPTVQRVLYAPRAGTLNLYRPSYVGDLLRYPHFYITLGLGSIFGSWLIKRNFDESTEPAALEPSLAKQPLPISTRIAIIAAGLSGAWVIVDMIWQLTQDALAIRFEALLLLAAVEMWRRKSDG